MNATPATPTVTFLDRLTRQGWLLAAALGFLVYLPALDYRFTYDDQAIIVDNLRIRRLDEPMAYLATNWWGRPEENFLYRPATLASFALNYAAGGLTPLGYHLVNNLLHALNCGLLWWLAWLLTGRTAAGARAATAAALLFAVHAVHVEAVAGVVGRAELLMTSGYLLALAAGRRSQEATRRGTRWRWAAAAGLGGLLAASAKEHGVTLPAAMALLILVPLDPATAPFGTASHRSDKPPRAEPWRQRWHRLAPALALAAAGVAVYLVARREVLGTILKPSDAAIPVVDNPLVALTGWPRRQAALAVLMRAAGLLLLPLRPSPNYGLAVLEPSALAESWLGPVGLALLLLAGVGLWVWRGRPLARVALALLLVTMSLGSNLIVLIGTILGERLLYLPSATVCLLAGSVLLERGWSARRRGVAGALAVWGTALLVLLLLYLPCWRDNTALSAYGIRRAPQSANLQLGYALELRDHGKLAPALEHVDEAARLDPTNLKIGAWRAVILAEAGRPEGLRELERVHVVDAGLDLVNQELARLLTARGETVRAERVLREGIRLAPKSLVNWLALTEWLAKQGRRAEAQQLLKSLEPALTSEQRDTARRWLAGPTEGAVTTPTLKMR